MRTSGYGLATLVNEAISEIMRHGVTELSIAEALVDGAIEAALKYDAEHPLDDLPTAGQGNPTREPRPGEAELMEETLIRRTNDATKQILLADHKKAMIEPLLHIGVPQPLALRIIESKLALKAL